MQIVSRETICMKCQSLFSGKNKSNISKLTSAEFAQRVVNIKTFQQALKSFEIKAYGFQECNK